jgi:hypothetical protein
MIEYPEIHIDDYVNATLESENNPEIHIDDYVNATLLVSKLESLNIEFNSDYSKTQVNSKSQHVKVRELFKIFNYVELFDKRYVKNIIKTRNNLNLKDGIYFIEELFGSQKSPDFMLINIKNGNSCKYLEFECKSGKNKIMWNDGYPRKDYIYYYYDKKELRGLIFSGGNKIICPDHVRKEIQEIINMTQSFNINSIDINWKLNIRRCFSQKLQINSYTNNMDDIRKEVINQIHEFFE